RRRTLPGVSSPCNVVRSIQVMARNNHAACHSFFTVRLVLIVAARRSTALRLIRTRLTQSISRGIPGLRSLCRVASACNGGSSTCSVRRFVVVIGVFPLAMHKYAATLVIVYVYLHAWQRALSS